MKLNKPRYTLTAAAASILLFSPTVGDAQDDPTLVTVTEVVSSNVAPLVPAAGTVFSRNETQITAGMAGRLKWLAEPGDFVEAGAAVAVFDCEMLELQKERQLAEAERAKINHETLIKEVERLNSVREVNVIAVPIPSWMTFTTGARQLVVQEGGGDEVVDGRVVEVVVAPDHHIEHLVVGHRGRPRSPWPPHRRGRAGVTLRCGTGPCTPAPDRPP